MVRSVARRRTAASPPELALAARGRSAEDPGVVAAAFVPAALGLLALILMVAAVQTVGAAILPGCLGYRAAVLKVRIHLPPAASPQTIGSASHVRRSSRRLNSFPAPRFGEVRFRLRHQAR